MKAIEDRVAYLFVPGNRPERFEKAMASGATPILDLEDAVASGDKAEARRCLAAAPEIVARSIIRVNACTSPEFELDIRYWDTADLSGFTCPQSGVNACDERLVGSLTATF